MEYYDIPGGDGLRRLIRNAREEAIYDILGGVHGAAEQLGITRQSVHYLLTKARLRDTDTARKLAEATERAGRPIPAAEILDLVPWRGIERYADRAAPPPTNGHGRRKRRNRRQSDAGARTAKGSDRDLYVVPGADQLQKQAFPRSQASPLPIDKDDPQGTGCSPHSQAA